MNGFWSTPSDGEPILNAVNSAMRNEEKYYALIVDSGAIIKHSGFSSLHNVAEHYVTVQGVIDEIRDSKARQHIETLPFKLEVRSPSAEGLSRVVEFSKKTGDYASLSSVDIHVLALHYDMEKEGCRNKISHIRTEPKRALTGRIVALNQNENNSEHDTESSSKINMIEESGARGDISSCSVVVDEYDGQSMSSNDSDDSTKESREVSEIRIAAPKSWASLVNPTAYSSASTKSIEMKNGDIAVTKSFGSMTLSSNIDSHNNQNGQFSDAEDEASNSDDDDAFASIGDDMSDEECDVYILDPEEVEARKHDGQHFLYTPEIQKDEVKIINELETHFPSLAATVTAPYEGSDEDGDESSTSNAEKLKIAKELEEQRKKEALKPLSNSGKLYNSFKKYSDIVSSSGVRLPQPKKSTVEENDMSISSSHSGKKNPQLKNDLKSELSQSNAMQSRIIGVSDQSNEIDDDGKGWISSKIDIVNLKASGNLDPFGVDDRKSDAFQIQPNLPSKSHRAACATTDFAMQNVILQMNLELLSINGVKIRKLKSWVSRCSACFHIYTGDDKNGKRLFCSKCGSASLQRIAASVDSKTGRLKLHFKKNYTYNKRGTQFALPKPGSQNRFMGDLLLAEDQLLYGALGQRARTSKGRKEAQSLFGSDITTSVGCDLSKRSDIKVGLGRKNPNSAAVGRERRGKKKKGVDEKACGLRRY